MADTRTYLWKDRKRIWCGLPWTFTTYAFDEDRLFVRSGLFTSTEDEIRLYRILDITMRRTLLQKIFGLGTIIIESTDKSLRNFEIKNIRNVENVKEMLSQEIETNREKKRISGRELIGNGYDDEMEDDE